MNMVSGGEGNICNFCIEQASWALQRPDLQRITPIEEEGEEQDEDISELDWKQTRPAWIKSQLDQYVVGQEAAKKALAVTLYNHNKCTSLSDKGTELEKEVVLEKANMLFIGPPGSGKTLLARTAALFAHRPFVSVSLTQVTQAGYAGLDAEIALFMLFQAARENLQATQRGIIFMDEVDKIARKGDSSSHNRDVGGEGVQQALLRMIEGGVVQVPLSGNLRQPDQRTIAIDTRNILFIFAGAFEGMDKIVEKRLKRGQIGFLSGSSRQETSIPSDKSTLLSKVTAEDLRSYGLIPEFVGRIPIITHLDTLDEEALCRVLTEPRNALIRQYQKLFQMEGVELSFSEEAVRYIAKKAIQLRLGARGLRSICESFMRDLMYDLPAQKKSKVHIDLSFIQQQLGESVPVSLSSVAVA